MRTDLYVINLENLTIEIRKPNSKPFLVATWYRSPSSPTDLFSSYESFIRRLYSLDLNLFSPIPAYRLIEISPQVSSSEQPDSKGSESINDISICNSNEISNAFNEHFNYWAQTSPRNTLTSDEESIYLNNIPENYNKLCFRPTTTSVVFAHLNRFSKTKATGLDDISARLIRKCTDIISGSL